MEKRKCHQNIKLFSHPRGFFSEVIIPPQGRNINSFYDSWSDSCLGPGLRRVLHQLRKHRTPRAKCHCNNQHNYFCDILCTASDLDNELNNLDNFLSIRKRIRSTIGDGKAFNISANDISYLDFTAKSLLELISCLKHKLTEHEKFEISDDFGIVNQTNKRISVLENKLYDLLGTIDEINTDSTRNLSCKRCSKHKTNITRPLRCRLGCPWKSDGGNPSDQERYGNTISSDYLPDNGHLLSLNRPCRTNKTGSKHRYMPVRHKKNTMLMNAQDYKLSGNNNSDFFMGKSNQCTKSEFMKTKTCKDFHSIFMSVCDRLNDCRPMVQKIYQNRSKNEKLNGCVQNKNHKSNNSLQQYKINSMAHSSSKTAAHPQQNAARRRRAGKDGSVIYDLLDHNPYSYNNNDRKDQGGTHIQRKNNQGKYYNKVSPLKNKILGCKRGTCYSMFSDYTSPTDSDVSDSSSFMETDFKNRPTQNKSSRSHNRSNKKRQVTEGKDYSYTNRKLTTKRGKKAHKNGKHNLNINTARSSSENIPDKHDFKVSNPNAKAKSYNTSSRRPKENTRLVEVKNPPATQRRTRLSSKYKNNKYYYKNSGVHPSKLRGYKKQSVRPNKSKVDNFLTRVRNNLSKVRLFSSKNPDSISESGTNKRNARFNSKTPYKDYQRIPKRHNIEYTYSRYPSRKRIRTHTNRHNADLIHSNESIVCSYSSSLSQSSYSNDDCTIFSGERNSYDYPYFFERVPSSFECANDYRSAPETDSQPSPLDISNSPQQSDMCPQMAPEVCNQPPNEDCELADEYEIIFEKVKPKKKCVRPKKVVCKKPLRESTPTPSTESSTSSSSLPEYRIVHRPCKFVRRRNRYRHLTIIKKRFSPSEEKVVRRSKHKRRRKFIRVGSQKFQESTENVVDYDFYQPNTFSRGTSTETFHPAEEKFTFHPPVKDTNSIGTSTEVLPLYAKKTSTSDLIHLIKVIGTNTDRVITKDTGVDPNPIKQRTPPLITEVKSTFTNTDKINIRSIGTNAISESPKVSVVNKATDPLFHQEQKDKTTNTAPEKKKLVLHVGTDPRPTEKLKQATKATDPLYYLGQQVKYTNTDPAITVHAQTETPKKRANVSIGTTTIPVRVQDQKTSYDKVKTSSRGNNPIKVKMSNKGFQFDTVEHKPAVKTVFTETFPQPRVGKTTQTSFIETPTLKPVIYEVQTQTERVREKPPPPILKPRKKSISEEMVVVEAKESSSPSELSMHLVFEKCQEELYKRRPKICKPKCSACCDHGLRVLVCDNIRSKQMILNSLSDCNVKKDTQRDKSSHSALTLTFTTTKEPLINNFTSNHDIQTVGKVQSPGRTRKLKLREECNTIGPRISMNKQNQTSDQNHHTESDEKGKSTIGASVVGSSDTTLTSCDWKNIAEKVKLSN